jgi:cytochrome b subunit of formate dehydrogenase
MITLSMLGAMWLMLAAPAPRGDADCLACHSDKDLKSAGGRSLYVDAAERAARVHADVGCADCHAGIKELPHPEALAPVECAACHADEVRDYKGSVHGTALRNGATDAATCASCHGPAHQIAPASDPASRVAKRNLPETCGSCHANPEFLARHKIPFARPVEVYRLSVHGRAVARGSQSAPSCSNCHGSHDIRPSRDQRSTINHWSVPGTCGACHAEIQTSYGQSVHGQAVERGVAGAPVCTDCHGEHAILAPSEPGSLVNPARVSSVTCGRCHGDERLAARYNLPRDKVPAFQDSYHGLALRAGSQTVANCASCHGVHNILPSRDPKSMVNAANVARTCGSCHPGAGQRFALGPVHVGAATSSEHPLVKWIRIAYLFLIPATVGFMLVHNLADFATKVRRGRRSGSGEEVERMNRRFRFAHALVVVSFPTLVVTGFALTYPDAWWSAPLLSFEGRLAFRGLVHRLAGVLLVGAMLYHIGHLIRVPRDRRILLELMPKLQDLKDLGAMLRANLGGGGSPPKFGAFSYAEKIEYWAFVWGTAVMALSGMVLWFENWSLRNWPKWVADAATALHWYEAILATLSILIWHLYMVVFDPDVYPMDRAWLTGRTSADHLRHTRPDYYRRLTEPKPRPALEPPAAAPAAAAPGSRPPAPDGPPETDPGKGGNGKA